LQSTPTKCLLLQRGDQITDAFVRLGQGILRQHKQGQIEAVKPVEPVLPPPEEKKGPCPCSSLSARHCVNVR
jgi:hypothetical protein